MTPPRPLLLTTRGRSSLQRLEGHFHAKALRLLRRLARNERHDCCKMRGCGNVYRSRLHPVRLIWFLDSEERIVVDRVAQRKDVYRGYGGPTLSPMELVTDSEPIEDEPEPEATDAAKLLARVRVEEWPGHAIPSSLLGTDEHATTAWWRFLLETFHRTPRLTDSQRREFDALIQRSHERPVLLQASPGTGKSVGALQYAIRQHREHGFSVYFSAPADLLRDLRDVVESIGTVDGAAFQLGEAGQLLGSLVAGPPVASTEIGLRALSECRKHSPGRLRTLPLTPRDVQLYEAFLCGSGNRKDVLFRDAAERLELLEGIVPDKWHRRVHELGFRTRSEIARAVAQNPPPAPDFVSRMLLIADEAQDLLLDEIEALAAIWKRWAQQGCEVHFWILGDLNQRISPTNFVWEDVTRRIGVEAIDRSRLRKNYRNTGEILRFANQTLAFAQTHQSASDARRLPDPAQPEDCLETGEPVGIVRVADESDGAQFLSQFRGPTEQRFLRRQLASKPKVLWPRAHDPQAFDRVLLLTAKQAKGREFEACVAFQMFAGDGDQTLEESLTWYTMLTRARSRLLLVVTDQEWERMGSQFFAACRHMRPREARTWIEECGSEVSLREIDDTVSQQLFALRRDGLPFLDTWDVLSELGISPENFERNVDLRLRAARRESLRELFEEAPEPWLKVLAARLLGCSDEALRQAERFLRATGDRSEYERLLSEIAADLSRSRRTHAGAWVRRQLGEPWPADFPFEDAPWDCEGWTTAIKWSLVAALATADQPSEVMQ